MTEKIKIENDSLNISIKKDLSHIFKPKFSKKQAHLIALYLSDKKERDSSKIFKNKTIDIWDWYIVSSFLILVNLAVTIPLPIEEDKRIGPFPNLQKMHTFQYDQIYDQLKPKFWNEARIAILISILSFAAAVVNIFIHK
jgi:hypothetical protein